jgi:ribosomal protein S18 acetylase RimI-like enzyme
MKHSYFIRNANLLDIEFIVAIWQELNLTRPWNDPTQDIKNCLQNKTSTILLLEDQKQIFGTAMVGYDGHRGWIYYFAIKSEYQDKGFGKKLLVEAENWLKNIGVNKVNLMVRNANKSVIEFYQNSGYKDDEVVTLSKWIDNSKNFVDSTAI